MKLRAVQFGFAVALGGALSGLGGAAQPAAAQSYLSDGSNSGSVTVDYSVLGQAGAGAPYGRAGLPNGTVGTCSCASAPLGVIASAPHPTFNSPYASAQVAQAPAVPPGFMPYSQAVASVGGGSSSGRIVLRPPSPQSSGAIASAPAPSSETSGAEMEPMESAEGNTPAPAITGSATTSAPSLPATTPTQSESQPAESQPAESQPPASANSGGEAGAPPAPEAMPSEVPSPVPPQMANAAPAAPAAGTENQAAAQPAPAPAPAAPATETPAPAPENQAAASTENQAQPEAVPAAPENQAAAENQPAPAPENQAAPATGNESGTATNNEQQAAVAPAAPAAGTANNAGAQNTGGALPAGAHRITYSGDSDDVPASSTADLDAVAKAMLADENIRVQVLAYASGTADEESKARRKSLARGLAVRSYLIKAGVRSTRIDVRALGSKADGGPADRVDVIPAS